jgi:hypothetical protein
VPKAVHIKNAFDFKLIDANRGCVGGGHFSLYCLLYVRFADEPCNAQEKVNCLSASLVRGLIPEASWVAASIAAAAQPRTQRTYQSDL